jgi:hypothetical protein
MKARIPVIYIGRQVGATNDEYLDLVDEPGGYTKVFDPMKHVIVGVAERARKSFEVLTAEGKSGRLKVGETMKTPIAQVTIERVEGRETDLLTATFYGEDALRQAGTRLQRWAETAPQEGGGHHKVNVKVVWESTEVRQTRYNLTRNNVAGVDLEAHIAPQQGAIVVEDYKQLVEFYGFGGQVVKQVGEKL